MPTCIDGHESKALDYCDVCGAELSGAAPPPVPPPPSAAAKACPACGMPSTGRFCEACGHDSALPAPPKAAPAPEPVAAPAAPSVWSVIIIADKDFHDRVVAREGPDTVDFPDFYPPRRIALRGETALIGRGKPEQGIVPEIDLGMSPSDRGVSSQHAVLRISDTGLTITDLDSTNGTSLNGSEKLIPKHEAIPLKDGDLIHVGAWTTIRIVKG